MIKPLRIQHLFSRDTYTCLLLHQWDSGAWGNSGQLYRAVPVLISTSNSEGFVGIYIFWKADSFKNANFVYLKHHIVFPLHFLQNDLEFDSWLIGILFMFLMLIHCQICMPFSPSFLRCLLVNKHLNFNWPALTSFF